MCCLLLCGMVFMVLCVFCCIVWALYSLCFVTYCSLYCMYRMHRMCCVVRYGIYCTVCVVWQRMLFIVCIVSCVFLSYYVMYSVVL